MMTDFPGHDDEFSQKQLENYEWQVMTASRSLPTPMNFTGKTKHHC